MGLGLGMCMFVWVFCWGLVYSCLIRVLDFGFCLIVMLFRFGLLCVAGVSYLRELLAITACWLLMVFALGCVFVVWAGVLMLVGWFDCVFCLVLVVVRDRGILLVFVFSGFAGCLFTCFTRAL